MSAPRRIGLPCVALLVATSACFDASGLGADRLATDAALAADALEDASLDAADATDAAHAPDAPDATTTADVTTQADADAAAEAEADVDATDDAPPPLVARLNIDGAALVGVDFPGAWTASPVPGVCGPNHFERATVHGTNDPGLFTGEAFGNPLACAIGGGALVAGTYRVRLYFAEIYWGPGCPGGGSGVGERLFSIALEANTVLSDFDVFATSGGCMASTTSAAGTPVVRSFDVVVTDGTLNLEGKATKDNAKISALEVFGPL